MFPLLKYSKEEIAQYYQRVTPNDVACSLRKTNGNFFDLLNLLSPAAVSHLDAMRQKATVLRQQYYGKTVSVYAPLYVSNSCINSCRYCDFNIRHKSERKTLTIEEIELECDAIRKHGIDSLLIVAGEDPKVVTIEYLCEIAHVLKTRFSCLSLEVAPQSQENYSKLFEAGYESLICFQETYDQELYKYLHPAGPKSVYEYRLWTQLRAGKAGFRTLGVAFLLGLTDWRSEAASLGAHAFYLLKECYQSKLQFAFPRITPVSDGFQPVAPVGEDVLEQMMLAFRIIFPQCGMTVSTRENPEFRDRIVMSAADNMSAGSRVTPGGYAVCAEEDVAQFTLNDSRAPEEVYQAIQAHNQEVVYKNWDSRI